MPPRTLLQSSASRLDVLDVRLRILAAFGLSFASAFAATPRAAGLALGCAVALCLMAGLPLRDAVRRLGEVNLFVVLVVITLPFTVKGEVVASWGTLEASRQGVEMAIKIALRANAAFLFAWALLATLSPVQFGYGLQHLGLSKRLVRLFLFLVRYVEVLHREYLRLRVSMKARGFHARADLHGLRTFGYLFGMLLVRGFLRAERVRDAMRCRGFDGHYVVRGARPLRAVDWVRVLPLFLLVAVLFLVDRAWML